MKINYVIAGQLQREYILPATGRPLVDVPGGPLLYAASGLAIWEQGIGLLARVGEDYPQQWLKDFQKYQWDTRGIHILSKAFDHRFFQVIVDSKTIQYQNPVAHFARLGLPFPKSLLGYSPPSETADDRKTSRSDNPHPSDIPTEYLDTSAIHLCPLDFTTTNRLSSAFRQSSSPVLTIAPAAGYMKPDTLEDIHLLLRGATAFLPTEEELRTLFSRQTSDVWEMASSLAAAGCEFIIVRRGERGQILYDAASKKRWEIPAYPSRITDPTGAGHAFCGGFLAGFIRTYDPLRATLHGNISSSMTIEGSGALHVMETLPGLSQARLESLATSIREV